MRKQIVFHEVLKRLIDDRPSIETTDPLFSFSNPKTNGYIKGYLLALSNRKELAAIEHYAGSRISDQFPLITSEQLQLSIDEIREVDINTPEGLQQIVGIIGRDHAWDWRRAMGITFLKGRLS